VSVLIVKNVTAEGPGTLEEHLRAANRPMTLIDLERGDPLPAEPSCSHLIILGGPMAVYEMDQVPYLRKETKLIEQGLKAGIPVLGVCLGSQLLAHVLGAPVYRGGTQEIGWDEVALTDEGVQDRCMRHLAIDGSRTAQVFQWHGDTFDLPAGGVRLASSAAYPNQAFRYGSSAYALQFHIEVTPDIVRGWLGNVPGIDLPGIDRHSREIYGPYRDRARGFYQSFFSSELSGPDGADA